MECVTCGRHIEKPKDDIKMELKEVGCGDVDSVDLFYVRGQWWAHLNLVTNIIFI
jgi:hypothetical protein